MPEIITRRLAVQLTKEERAVRAFDLAQTLHEVALDESLEKARAKYAKEQIAKKVDRVEFLRDVVRTNEEYRDVVCHEVPVPGRHMVDIVRTDTGKVVDTREMTETERQVVLFPPLAEVKSDDDKNTLTKRATTATIGEQAAAKKKRKGGDDDEKEREAKSQAV
jgi:hypothetical protein